MGLEHHYQDGQHKIASITTMLHSRPNPGIDKWKRETPNWKEILAESNKVGRDFHTVNENYLKNQFHRLDKSLYTTKSMELFFKLRPSLDKINNIRCQEQPMLSSSLRVAGTVDCVADYDGVLSVIDFKNSRKNKDKYMDSSGYFEQVTAYALLFENATRIPVEQGVVMVADWNGGVSIYEIKISSYVDRLISVIEQYYAKK